MNGVPRGKSADPLVGMQGALKIYFFSNSTGTPSPNPCQGKTSLGTRVPGMGINVKVKVLMKVDDCDQSEAQGHEGDRLSEGSVERNLWADEEKPDIRQCLAGQACGLPRSSCGQGKGTVDPAAMQRRLMFLPGEISFCA
jgi:hypothetical protein